MISRGAIDYLRLSLVPRVGAHTAHLLIEQAGSVSNVWQQSPEMLRQIDGVGEKLVQALSQAAKSDQAKDLISYCESSDIHIICAQDACWPQGLSACADAPLVLYVRGQLACLQEEKVVAIVGARKASAEGKLIARRWSSFCSMQDVVVVSGMAPGIDSAAHGGSLDAKKAGIAILGYGLDAGSAQQSKQIQAMAELGCVVSEYPPRAIAQKGYFPQRNRLIAGMAQALVVVEGGLKSGSMITARQALQYGREIFAVPGSILNDVHAGCHALIQDGAILATSAETILSNMHWRQVQQGRKVYQPSSEIEASIMAILSKRITHIDNLAEDCSLTVPDLSTILLALELEGVIEKLPGSRYTLS